MKKIQFNEKNPYKNAQITDEELAQKAKTDKNAMEQIVRKYSPLIYSLVRKNFEKNYGEDYGQELWVKFIERVKKYDKKRNDNFAGYIKALMYLERWNILNKHMKIIRTENEDIENVEIAICDKHEQLEKEDLIKTLNGINFTKTEKTIIKMKIKNPKMTQKEIAEKLKKSQVAISKTMKKIKNKMEVIKNGK